MNKEYIEELKSKVDFNLNQDVIYLKSYEDKNKLIEVLTNSGYQVSAYKMESTWGNQTNYPWRVQNHNIIKG